MEKFDKSGSLPEVAEKLGIGEYHRHVFLCTGDKCCTTEVGLAAWDVLKQELKDRKLSLSSGPNACYRTKVGCLRICQSGPVAVVQQPSHVRIRYAPRGDQRSLCHEEHDPRCK